MLNQAQCSRLLEIAEAHRRDAALARAYLNLTLMCLDGIISTVEDREQSLKTIQSIPNLSGYRDAVAFAKAEHMGVTEIYEAAKAAHG